MQPRDIALVTGTLACMCAPPAFGQSSTSWVDMKNPSELRALYSNKTFTGKGPSGEPFVAYYKANGTGLLVWNKQRIPRTWVVKGDEVCITDPKETNCFRFQHNEANPREIVGRQVPDAWAFFFTAEDGVPKF